MNANKVVFTNLLTLRLTDRDPYQLYQRLEAQTRYTPSSALLEIVSRKMFFNVPRFFH